HYAHVETFVVKSKLTGESNFRNCAMADRSLVVLVYYTITVDVPIAHVSGHNIGQTKLLRSCSNFFCRLEESHKLISKELSDWISFAVHVFIRLRFFTAFNNFIAGKSKHSFDVILEISNFFIPSQFNF